VQWNQLPDTTWIYTTVAAPATCYQFTNHYGDVNELQVATICENGDTSAFSPLVTWTNYLVCAAPESLVSSNVTATSADLSWSANPDANKYRVLYKNGGNKTIVDVTGTAVSVSSLPSSTKIKWKVKSRCKTCGASNWGSYSAFQSFTTAALKQVVPGQQSSASMVIFPNPAEVSFTINFNEGYSSQQPYTLAVQDMAGRILLMNEGTLTDGSLIQDISFNGCFERWYLFRGDYYEWKTVQRAITSNWKIGVLNTIKKESCPVVTLFLIFGKCTLTGTSQGRH
jgi:hypothetical protein